MAAIFLGRPKEKMAAEGKEQAIARNQERASNSPGENEKTQNVE